MKKDKDCEKISQQGQQTTGHSQNTYEKTLTDQHKSLINQ